MVWTPDVISKEYRSMPPISVGELLITNVKVRMVFNVGSRALWSGANTGLIYEIVRTGDANVSDGNECLS